MAFGMDPLIVEQQALQAELQALLELCRKNKERKQREAERQKKEEEELRRLPYFFDEVGLFSGTPSIEVSTGYECRRTYRRKKPGETHGRWYCERYDGTVVPLGNG